MSHACAPRPRRRLESRAFRQTHITTASSLERRDATTTIIPPPPRRQPDRPSPSSASLRSLPTRSTPQALRPHVARVHDDARDAGTAAAATPGPEGARARGPRARDPEPPPDARTREDYHALYVEYLKLFRDLEETYDGMCHPQKRDAVRAALEATLGRVIELRRVLYTGPHTTPSAW